VGAAAAKPPSGRAAARNFYRHAVDEAERADLDRAGEIEGLDDEIALLRLRLRRALQEHPQDVQLLTKGMEILVRAVATRYRLSAKSKRDLADNLAATLNSLGDQLLPPER
jgi:RNase P protein component